MNEQWISRLKKWGSLAIVFIVIVCISGALPRYLTPPAAQPQQTVKKNSTKTIAPTPKIDHLAIVNEDQGATLGGQRLNLGNQVVPLFSNGDDYQWETVSRSVADNGLKQGDYQAVFYIPSDFTTNIFTYNEQKPKTAVISYRANPKLTAEDSAKVQTEFQKVKGTLNQQFSQIYWRMVSDRINYVNGNFADVLNKEKQYLQAMANFYKPSSRDMAQVFNDQLSQINELLSETKQVAAEANDKQQNLTETKNQINQQLEALNKLNDQLNEQLKEQTQMLEKTRDENDQLVQDATDKAQKATTDAQSGLTDLMNQYQKGMQDPLSQTVSLDQVSVDKEFGSLTDLYKQFNSNFTVDDQNLFSLFDKDQTYNQDALDLQKSYLISAAKTAYSNEFNTAIASIKSSVMELANNVANGVLNDQTDALTDARDNLGRSESSGSSDDVSSSSSNSGSDSSSQSSAESSSSIQSSETTESDASTAESAGTSGTQSESEPEYQLNFSDLIPKLEDDISEKLSKNDYYDKDTVKKIEQTYIGINGNHFNWSKYDVEQLFNFYGALRDVDTALNAGISANQKIIDKANSFDEIKFSEAPIEEGLSEDQSIVENQKLIDDNTKAFKDSVGGLAVDADTTNKNANQFKSDVQENTDSIKDKNNSTIQLFQSALDQQKSDLEKVENVLANNVANAQKLTAAIVKPIQLTDPDINISNTDNGNGISFTLQDNNFDELSTLDEGIQSISDSQSAILQASKDVQSMVNGVQGDANQLAGSWGQNIDATAQLGNAIAQTLGNTGEPGNRNQSVYQQLTSPVSLAGQKIGAPKVVTPNTNQGSESAADDTAPIEQPFLTLLAVLIASILTGFFSYHYRNLSVTANALISILLGLVTSSAVIYYGISQYGLDGTAAIMWSIFTVGLIAVMSAWIREAYQLSEIVGVLILTAMIVIFTLPLLRNSLDRFAFQNPAADVYMAIAYGPDYLPFYKGLMAIVGLFVPVFAVIGIRAIIQHVREEKAHETEIM
ncbi:type VII secretion protein EsaA [Sporolactobacillus laevolacticus]|uniref:type VII secretion protein EsaA n=1 Tax=Sporolactobacillus laevolacticus TaxID=33018 RepID=UPI0025B2868F|nr:type VII secretion protein EsaA [Sporolactobacillus laevolacticus]MDN3955288.1 type VII secretion protein EsaA [Sporolactobacillus laevolacticus]